MYKALLIIISSIFLSGCNIKNFFVTPPAGLVISSTPTSTVFLNDENQGETPFQQSQLKPGTYILKLVPTGSSNFASYETKLDLTSGTSTVISRSFAESELDASGYTLSLVQESPDETSLSIISDPDLTSITLDGTPRGFTPLSRLSVPPGPHTLLISSPGYQTQELTVTTMKGYNLIVNFKLAASVITLTPPQPATVSASPSVSPTPSSSPISDIPKPYVVIGETETGWLRVRSDASGSSAELGKANTGEKLKYLGVSSESGWHKIEFEGQVGYVSGKYVTLVK